MYKIIFNLLTPIAFIDLPIFDSILSYCVYQKKYRKITDYNSPSGKEIIEDFEKDIPLKKNESGFFYCSFMCFENDIESIAKWRKRWKSKYDKIANFKKAKRQVHIGQGYFKSYDMPLLIHSIDKVWFYFNGDKEKIEELINNNLYAIGKKVKAGWGWIKNFKIEESNKEKMLYYRTLPNKKNIYEKLNKMNHNYDIEFGSYKLPYWKMDNFEDIIIVKREENNIEKEGNK